jgi:hypothetical protein
MPFDPSIPATLKELSDYYAKKQPHQVEILTEETPILSRIKFEQASHGLWNAYEEMTDIKGAGMVDMNAVLPVVGVATELKKIDLNIFGGVIECPEDTAKMYGGHSKYFAKRMPSILRKSGMDSERGILYKNLLAYSLANKGLAVSAGGTATVGDKTGLYCIIALRQVPGETIGLYSPDGFKQGAMFDVTPVNGGSLHYLTTGIHQGVLGYALRLKAYFGFQIANPRTVGAIVNIKAANLPTPAMIDNLLADVRATPASTVLLMHPRLLGMLNTYKAEKLEVQTATKDIDRRFTHWNGIEILTSYNFEDGNEKVATVI